jgi:hypothetical protein
MNRSVYASWPSLSVAWARIHEAKASTKLAQANFDGVVLGAGLIRHFRAATSNRTAIHPGTGSRVP